MVLKTIRLACTDCQRQDHDGITQEQFLAVKRQWGAGQMFFGGLEGFAAARGVPW
jgi:hypothetical protein